MILNHTKVPLPMLEVALSIHKLIVIIKKITYKRNVVSIA